MNDTELNEILDQWNPPEPPESLRRKTLAAYTATVPHAAPRRRVMLWAFGLASFLVVLTVAFPQTVKLVAPGEKPPYTVESGINYFAPDGTVEREENITSFNDSRGEAVLSRTIVGSVWGSLLMQMHHFLFGPVRGVYADTADAVAKGCVTGPLVGRETILHYDTVAIRREGSGLRYTVWRAPALACFAMRLVTETQQPDGSWRRAMERHALRVTINR